MASTFGFIDPSSWSDAEQSMWTDAFEGETAFQDEMAMILYHHGYFNFDAPSSVIVDAREALDAYLMDEYGVDFAEVFDWQAYRDAYSDS